MTLSKAFLHLHGALRYPDLAWRQEMASLPALPPTPGPRRASSRLAGPWMVLIVGPVGVGKTTLYKTRLARLFSGVEFLNERRAHTSEELVLPRHPGSPKFDELVDKRQDFVCELDLPEQASDWPVERWVKDGYHTALLALSLPNPQNLAQRCQSIELGQALSSNARDFPRFLSQACSRFHATWWLDCSENNQPPTLTSHWVEGKLIF